MPFSGVAHQRHIEPIGFSTLAVTQHTIALVVVVSHRERAIVVQQLQGIKQVAIAQRGRISQQGAGVAVLSNAKTGKALRQGIGVLDVDCTGRGKVTLGCIKRSLAVVQRGC